MVDPRGTGWLRSARRVSKHRAKGDQEGTPGARLRRNSLCEKDLRCARFFRKAGDVAAD